MAGAGLVAERIVEPLLAVAEIPEIVQDTHGERHAGEEIANGAEFVTTAWNPAVVPLIALTTRRRAAR
ncbi:hypothetical protein [Amycolatopsis sp. CA-230715]|uniref:hypothetical protein n=1 Tax=Amycolatopsis sp. CA-230715 TaxID=2745196 RepID=UPI001C02BF6E|nr:hypothetical protein [Amycolatopsis sp. CA-230715]